MLIKITPDKERALSIYNSIADEEEFLMQIIPHIEKQKFSSSITKQFYEIARQLATALLYIDGYKAIGEYAHCETIFYLRNYSQNISESEIVLFDDLRNKRNKNSYEGKPIEITYIQQNKEKLKELIKKLKLLVESKLKENVESKLKENVESKLKENKNAQPLDNKKQLNGKTEDKK